MKTFDTLYKRAKTGAIQYWSIKTGLSDPDANNPHDAYIEKEAGQLGTKNPVIHREEIIEGKNIGKSNETSPYQQAELQAESDWKRKRDEGYKSVEDLIDSTGFDTPNLAEWLDKRLPQFNTDASGNVKPMLAKDVNWDKVQYPCFVQPKLDGVRCLLVTTGDGAVFLSRSGKRYTTLGHIATGIEKYLSEGYEDFILDGEIYSHELTFQEITQAVKKQYPNSIKLQFRAYDIVNDSPQSERINQLKDIIIELIPYVPTDVSVVETRPADNAEEVKGYHDKWVQEGYEGAMIRLLDGHYAQGQRSSHLLKVKEFDETEFKVIGMDVTFPLTDRTLDEMTFKCVTNNEDNPGIFNVKPTGSREKRRRYVTDYPQLQYKLFTVKHFGWTDDKLPRFPIGKAFRDYE